MTCGLHPWPTTQGTPGSHSPNTLTSPGREKVLTEAPVVFVLSLSTTCRNAHGGRWVGGWVGFLLILETRAQKADGQIRAVSPHDRSSRCCRAGSPKHLCWVPAENKTHPEASPPAGTLRVSSGQAIALRKTKGHSARSGVKQPRNRPGTETRTHRSLCPRSGRPPRQTTPPPGPSDSAIALPEGARAQGTPRKDRGGRGAWPTAVRAGTGREGTQP